MSSNVFPMGRMEGGLHQYIMMMMMTTMARVDMQTTQRRVDRWATRKTTVTRTARGRPVAVNTQWGAVRRAMANSRIDFSIKSQKLLLQRLLHLLPSLAIVQIHAYLILSWSYLLGMG